MTEEAFKTWKDQTRQDALEKEVKRLRERSYKQSGKIGSLRRTVYFTWFFFIVLFAVMFSKGMISIQNKKTEHIKTTPVSAKPQTTTTTTTDTLSTKVVKAVSDTIKPLKETKGVLYCVQIGAFTGINLDEFNDNLVSLQQDSYGGINQFTLGRFKNYDKAVKFLNIVQHIGFHDAFIMSFQNGERVPLNEIQSAKDQTPVTTSSDKNITLPYQVPEEKPLTDNGSAKNNNQ